jgi:predicted ATPase
MSMAAPRDLRRIRVAGYKSIRDATIDLRSLNILVGANGAGKSNLVQVFDLLGALVEERLAVFVRQSGGAAQLLHGGPQLTRSLDLALQFESNSYELTLGFGAQDDLVFEHEVASFQGQDYSEPYELAMATGGLESRLPESARTEGRVAAWVLASLEAYRVYHFHDTSVTAPVKRAGRIDDSRYLRPDASNLAAFLYRIRETERAVYGRILSAVRSVAPFFLDFDLRPTATDPEKIKLEWRQQGSSQYLDAHALSDGTLRFIALATLLFSTQGPRMLVLDEPELGLHPYAIRQLAAMLQAASQSRQVLVATQSVALVDQFGLHDIVVVDREEGASAFRRLGPEGLEQWLADYSVGELWEKNLLGGGPRVERRS